MSHLATPTAAPCDIQVFTADGTWEMPQGANAVQITLIAGGGGGCAGAGETAGTVAYGGGGGGGGGWAIFTIPAVSLSSTTVAITVGVGGVGGVGGVTDTATDGGNTTFGDIFAVRGGGQGLPYNISTANNGGGGATGSMITPQAGGSGGSIAEDGSAQPQDALFSPGCPGGGGGGTVTADPFVGQGGPSTASYLVAWFADATPAGSGTDGVDGMDTPDPNLPGPGSSGGGGGSAVTGTAGNGGNGGLYGAGGGGGGGTTGGGDFGGDGGAGAPGICVVTTFF